MQISLDSLRIFVAQLGARPGMWLGPSMSLRTFAAAVVGYETALRDVGVVPLLPIGRQFSEWLCTEWKVSRIVGWEAHVEERFGNDTDAIAEAAKLIEQWFRVRDLTAYRASQAIHIYLQNLAPPQQWTHR